MPFDEPLPSLDLAEFKRRLDALGVSMPRFFEWVGEPYDLYYRWREGRPVPGWVYCALHYLEHEDRPSARIVERSKRAPVTSSLQAGPELVEAIRALVHPEDDVVDLHAICMLLGLHDWSLPDTVIHARILEHMQQLLVEAPTLEQSLDLVPGALWPTPDVVSTLLGTSVATISRHLRGLTKKSRYTGVKLDIFGWRIHPRSTALLTWVEQQLSSGNGESM